MVARGNDEWQACAETYAFLGNSLLEPMTRTPALGLEPAFWETVPNFGDVSLAAAVQTCATFAANAGQDAVERCAVEYTHLFVGPPKPAAPPWETMYANEDVTVGFGQATFDMRTLLREAGLEVKNENNQYEDHLGIELLYLATLCSRAAGDETADAASIAAFIEEHPLSWIEAFHACIAQARPGGYFDGLVGFAHALLAWHATALRATS